MSKLRELREERGLSLKQVADSIKTDVGHLSRIERGVHTPSGKLALKLHQFYDEKISVAEILSPPSEAA